MTVAVYLRISQDRAGLELGIDRQRGDCLACAAARGWPAPERYEDNDASATSGKRRPEYERLMADVRAGRITRVIVWHTSRLWRNRVERAAGIEVFKAARVSLVAVKGPELDMATASGRMLAGLLGEFDTAEGDVKAERQRAESLQRAERGGYAGGPRAYGYAADGMTLVAGEAERLKRWYGEFLAGRSLTSIAAEAERNHSSMRVILMNPRNAGLRVLNGVEYPGQWPAIVPEETWRAAVALLTDPARRSNTANVARRWLGSGLYRCERCDGRPVGITQSGAANGARPVYWCDSRRGGCGRSWDARKLDIFMELVIQERLSRDDLDDLLPRDRPDIDALRAERREVRARLDRAAEQWTLGSLDDAQLQAASRKGKARLAELDAALAEAGASNALAPLLGLDAAERVALWEAIPAEQVERRQRIVRGLMTITLGPSPRGRAPYRPEIFVRIDDPQRP